MHHSPHKSTIQAHLKSAEIVLGKILMNQEATAFIFSMTRIHKTWHSSLLKFVVALGCGLCLPVLLVFPGMGGAEWSLRGEGKVFYTNDVALFSASRRLDRLPGPNPADFRRRPGETGR